jgi:peptidoglycan/xylan/chitin deacetylase (PgdA/CDA1 family)
MTAVAESRRAVPVLLYHGVAGDCSESIARFTVSPAAFDAQLRYLADEGYQALTVSAFRPALLGSTEGLPARPVLITFDDGFRNTVTEAAPILARYGFASTLYVTTGFLGDGAPGVNGYGDPMLSWAEVGELAAAGVEIGGHTHSHPMLDTLPHGEARTEIVRCKELIEDHLGRPVASFAYPHGYSSAWVRHQVQKAGYTTACAVKNALSHLDDDLFAIARLTIEAGHSLDTFIGMVTGRSAAVAGGREQMKTRGWRLARRAMATGRRIRERI